MRRAIRTFTLFCTILVSAVMGFVAYLNYQIPDRFYISDPDSFVLGQYDQITTSLPQFRELPAGQAAPPNREAKLKLFGIIPVKNTWLHTTETPCVVPCGTPFGLKMLTEGVVIVGLNPVETSSGTVYPASHAGLKEGDIILTANKYQLHSAKELTLCIRNCGGNPVRLEVRRGEEVFSSYVRPVKGIDNGEYRCGIWVRDSSAGIGTVTFYDPASAIFGGLGHAVCDVDTGKPLPLSSGEVVPVHISGVKKGKTGAPGELQGNFLSSIPAGNLALNNETGIYGFLSSCPVRQNAVPILFRQEVKQGPAQILTTISGNTPKLYDIEIESVSLGDHAPTKNMVIRITDPELLRQTGGIVQGMSGSPILQNGKLAGAVTHVFVNNPQKGYGIFAENMLDNCKKLKQQKAADSDEFRRTVSESRAAA